MQQLGKKLKNVPMDTSHVRSSTSSSLNRVQRLSEENMCCFHNNPEVNHSQHTGRAINPLVYVLSKEGNSLMPCSQAKAKKLLKKGACRVIKRFPFTVQLNFECGNQVQKVTLGIDSGYENIGFSAVTETKELISGIVKLDGKTSERLTERRMYRRIRRNKLWYRKPRFLNRARKEGWLSPSIQRRYDTHLNIINRLKKILPISETIIEVANFDIQKIMNPDISGTDYQQGSLYEYQNMRSYLMAREQGKCQLCGKDFKGQSSHIHHCKQRSESGSNRPENLVILHEQCHEKLHKKGLKLSKPKSYKSNTFMNIINKKFYQDIPDVKITYGNITFVDRNNLGLEKSHVNDAFVIAKGTMQKRIKEIDIKQVHRNNRVLQLNRKGFKPSIKRKKSKVNPYDLFWVNGKQYSCKGMFNKGQYITYGSTKNKEYFKFSDVDRIYHQGSFVWNM